MHNKNITSEVPKWMRITVLFCGIFTVLFSGFYIAWVLYNGLFLSHIYRCSVFFIVILLVVYLYPKTLYYSVTATEKGIETHNIVGTNKNFQWEDIIEVRRYRFGFPFNFTYVIKKNDDRIFLIKNRENYDAIVQRIKEKATNLRLFNP